ncbi:MAG: hypothetical protein ACRDFB_01545, partial [Rhabdochlamydiaceae bacterium]
LLIVEPFNVEYWVDKDHHNQCPSELYAHEDKLATAWCKSSLGIRAKNNKDINFIRQLHKAILDKDAAVWCGGGHVFKSAGLIIGVISAIPDKEKQEMYDSHLDYHNLMVASETTGIKAKIDAANQEFVDKNNLGAVLYKPYGYSSLRPEWVEGRKKDTKYKVMYWLNPWDQEKYKSGYYTVEELLEWIDGCGPILKNLKVSQE